MANVWSRTHCSKCHVAVLLNPGDEACQSCGNPMSQNECGRTDDETGFLAVTVVTRGSPLTIQVSGIHPNTDSGFAAAKAQCAAIMANPAFLPSWFVGVEFWPPGGGMICGVYRAAKPGD